MGCCSSKTDEEGDDAPTYQMKHIYYDFEGNLRCGHVSNDKDEELRQVTLGDAISAKLKEEVSRDVSSTVLVCVVAFVLALVKYLCVLCRTGSTLHLPGVNLIGLIWIVLIIE